MGEAAAPSSRSPRALPPIPSLTRESENRDGSPGRLSPPHRLQRSPGAQLLQAEQGLDRGDSCSLQKGSCYSRRAWSGLQGQ